MENKTPFVIQPETFKDDRGVLFAYNDFDFQELNIIRTFSIEVESF